MNAIEQALAALNRVIEQITQPETTVQQEPAAPVMRASYGGVDLGPIPQDEPEQEPEAQTEQEGAGPSEAEPVQEQAAVEAKPGFDCWVDRAGLLAACQTAAKAVSRRSPLTVLQMLHLLVGGEMVVTGSDLDVSIRAVVPCSTMRSGETVVDAVMLIDALKAMSDQRVNLTVQDEKLRIGGSYRIRCGKAEDWPKIPWTPTTDNSIVLTSRDAARLKNVFGQVAAAASSDDARPVLTGVAFESSESQLRLVATDSYRLALSDTGIPFAENDQVKRTHYESAGGGRRRQVTRWEPWLIPAKHLKKVFAVSDPLLITFTEPWVRFDSGGVTSQIRLIEGVFPNYRQLLPEGREATVFADAEPLLAALKQLKPIAADAVPVRLEAEDGTLLVAASRQAAGGAQISISGSMVTEPLDGALTAINHRYLTEGICAGRTAVKAKAGRVALSIVDPLKPYTLTLRGVDGFESYLYLGMPVRL